MLSKKILMANFKNNKIFILYMSIGIITMLSMMLGMYPLISENDMMNDLLKTMPEELLKAFSSFGQLNNLNDFLYMKYYNSVHLYILMGTVIVLIDKLLGKPLEDTSLVYFLNAKVSRKKFLLNQIIALNTATFIITFVSVVFGGVASTILFKNKFILIDFLKINIFLTVLFMLIGALNLALATFTKDGDKIIVYMSIFTIGGYFIDMVSKITDKLDNLKYLTVFRLYKQE